MIKAQHSHYLSNSCKVGHCYYEGCFHLEDLPHCSSQTGMGLLGTSFETSPHNHILSVAFPGLFWCFLLWSSLFWKDHSQNRFPHSVMRRWTFPAAQSMLGTIFPLYLLTLVILHPHWWIFCWLKKNDNSDTTIVLHSVCGI